METSNLPDTELKALVIKMFSELRGRVDELSETFNQEIKHIKMNIENTKKDQSEMKNTLKEINSGRD